jgi:perosamine synthetase
MIPYGKQTIDEDDIQAVIDVLRSDWLTTGPKVEEFEEAFAHYVGAKYAVAVSSGTAALHAAMYALGIGSGDEVIVPPMTFAATANCVVYQGGTPVFADVEPETLLIDPAEIEKKITPKTKAIIAVDYAGQPCNYDALQSICKNYNIPLVADACHSLGARYKDRPVGTLADLTVFSFHPVKHITTGEGGMITTDNSELAARMRIFRNHGITTDHRQREVQSSWFYEMVDLGYNYRITDFQCALGMSQLKKLPQWIAQRQEIAAIYDEALADIPGIQPLGHRPDVLRAKEYAGLSPSNPMLHAPCSLPSTHAYHLYVVRLNEKIIGKTRQDVFASLRNAGIGVNVHYIPVHLHPFYHKRFNTAPGLCPIAERAYANILSLPIFPSMRLEEVQEVINAVESVVIGDTQ